MKANLFGMAVVTIVGVLTLVGCATARLADTSADAPSPTQSPECVFVGTDEMDVPGCVVIDGEKSMQQNETYRDRKIPTAEDQAILDQALLSAEAALQAISTPLPTVDQVKNTLTAEGLTSVEAVSSPTIGVGFWAKVQMNGCLFGDIAPETGLTIEAGGFIADGGCHALSGH